MDAFVPASGAEYLPMVLAIVSHMFLGAMWYGPVAGKQFVALAHPKGLDGPGPSWLYVMALACAAASYFLFHTIVVATNAGGNLIALMAIGLAVLGLDFAGNMCINAFEMRPVALMSIHILYHVVSVSVAVFWYTFLGSAAETSTLDTTPLFEINIIALGAAFLIWEVTSIVWYSTLFSDLFVQLAFGDSPPDSESAEAKEASDLGMTLNHAGAVVAAFILERTVAVAKTSFGMDAVTCATAAAAVVAFSAIQQHIHPGFEHRPVALVTVHQACHLVAAILVGAALSQLP